LTAILATRIGAGLIALIVSVLGATKLDWDGELNTSFAIMGGFILIQTLGSYLWARPYIGKTPESTPPPAGADNPYADAAKVAITTQGVVLGLISFADGSKLSLTVKVGAASLAAGVLLASSLYLLVVQGPPPDPNRGLAASFLLTFLLWALGFGLVCVVIGNWSAR
jgi:hypothetical protein